jgi:titin
VATISWGAAVGNGASVTSYAVTPYVGAAAETATTFVCGTGVGEIDCGAAPVTATVNGLNNGTSYTFTVTATNKAGTGTASSPSNSVIPATAPAPPTAVAAEGGNETATITFSAPSSNGGAPVLSYTVTPYIGTTAEPPTTFDCNPGDFQIDCGAVPISATVPSLQNGTTYTFTVAATNDAATSVSSPASNSVLVGAPGAPPTAPTASLGPTQTPGDGEVALSWTPAMPNAAAVSSYTITPYIGASAQTATTFGCGIGAGDVVCNTDPINAVVTGLTPGTAYTFAVTATNSYGDGLASPVSNSLTPYTIPGAPGSPLATPGNSASAILSFSESVGNGSAITSYPVTPYLGATAKTPITFECGTAAGEIDCGAAPVAVTVNVLTFGTTYTFTVTATNAAGAGAASSSSNSVTTYAANGSGTMSVVPTFVSARSAGNTLTFTYAAVTGRTRGGAIDVVVPSGWSAPSRAPNAAGYVTSTCGTVATSGSTIKDTGVTLIVAKTCTITYGSKAGHGPGAVASTTAGGNTFKSYEASTPPGALVALKTSPVVKVYAANGSGTMKVSPTTVTAGSKGNTLTLRLHSDHRRNEQRGDRVRRSIRMVCSVRDSHRCWLRHLDLRDRGGLGIDRQGDRDDARRGESDTPRRPFLSGRRDPRLFSPG